MTPPTALILAAGLSLPCLLAVTLVFALALSEAWQDWRGGLGLRRNALMLALFGTLWTSAALAFGLVVAVWHLSTGGWVL